MGGYVCWWLLRPVREERHKRKTIKMFPSNNSSKEGLLIGLREKAVAEAAY